MQLSRRSLSRPSDDCKGTLVPSCSGGVVIDLHAQHTTTGKDSVGFGFVKFCLVGSFFFFVEESDTY